MSEAMQNVIEYLETGSGDLWVLLYDLSRDELIKLFRELDYAVYDEYGRDMQREIYAKMAESLKEF